MMNVHHIGYLVKQIDKAAEKFQMLGYVKLGETVYDSFRDVQIQFLEKDGYRIELVSPVSEKSVVFRLLKKYKNMPYHICYEAEDFERDMKQLQADGFLKIDEPCPAPAIGGRRVCFLASAVMGMVEIVEEVYG